MVINVESSVSLLVGTMSIHCLWPPKVLAWVWRARSCVKSFLCPQLPRVPHGALVLSLVEYLWWAQLSLAVRGAQRSV